MKIIRSGSAIWSGGIGKGAISTESGALDVYPYGFASRFEGKRGTNPEELLAAAHAGCFTMALSQMLSEPNLVATRIDTSAKVTLEQSEAGFAITKVELMVTANIPNLDNEHFQQLAAKTKANCPVSKLFRAEITLEAKLV
jgi:lipoyl-dependent peroxiredoxin